MLDLFSDAPSWSQSEIAEATGIPLPTVHRLCATLLAAGYLEREAGGRRLRSGLRVVELAAHALSSFSALDVVGRHLRELAEVTGETANAAVLSGSEVVYVQSAAGVRLLRPQVATGLRAPAYCTAIGKCMLAALPPAEARSRLRPEPYPARTGRSITRWAAMARSLAEIRAAGIAESDQEYELGLYSLAVQIPSLDDGRPSAISVSPPTTRATGNDRHALVASLERARHSITADMAAMGG